MSKIKKLPEGEAEGCKTYGNICKPKSGSSKPCALNLRDQAADKIVKLMTLNKNYKQNKNFKYEEYLKRQNEFAKYPNIVQFAYWRAVLEDLRKELKELKEENNTKKIEQFSPIIEKQIEETEIKMRELFEEIKKGRE